MRKPCVRELEREARNHQNNETGKQNKMLPALIRRHPHHKRILNLPPLCRLLPPDNEVVQEHRPNHNQDQCNVNQPHPLHRQRANVVRLHAILMYLCLRKLLGYALVALAAGRVEIGLANRRMRIARRENIVHAMAARAIRRHHRPALRSQPMIAVKVA